MLDTWVLIFRMGLQNCLTCALLTKFMFAMTRDEAARILDAIVQALAAVSLLLYTLATACSCHTCRPVRVHFSALKLDRMPGPITQAPQTPMTHLLPACAADAPLGSVGEALPSHASDAETVSDTLSDTERTHTPCFAVRVAPR